jgi:hypothetical protein
VNVFGFRGGKRGKHGSGPLTGFSECFLFDPNFSGKDFWCAEYVDCTAENAMMLSLKILEIFFRRVNVSEVQEIEKEFY